MRLAHWVAIAGCVAGTIAVDRVAQAGGDQYALIWDDAELYTQPRADATIIEVRAGKAKRSLGDVFPAKVIGNKNGFVHVRTTSWGHCHRAFPATNMELDLYVRPGAIADSTANEETFQFNNGTKARLRAGMHVMTAAGTSTVRLFGTDIALPRTPATGRYTKGPRLPSRHRNNSVKPRSIYRLGSARFTRQLRGNSVAVIKRRGSRVLVELTERCVRAEVLTAKKNLGATKTADLLGSMTGRLGGLARGNGDLVTKSNAVLYWKDGTRAGVARRPIVFPAGGKGRVCKTRNIAEHIRATSMLEVCVDVSSLEKSKFGYGKGGGGGLGRIGTKGARVKTGKPTATGSRPRDQILKVVASRKRSIRACYERELQRTKGIAGKVVIAWTIKADGRVTKARVKTTTMRNKRVEDCIVRQVARLRFPTAKTRAKISFPFVFAVR